MGSYSIAKAALEALVRVSADELGALEVRVNAVRPGLAPTKVAKPGLMASDEKQRAADLEILARSICGDDSNDRALRGQLPAEE